MNKRPFLIFFAIILAINGSNAGPTSGLTSPENFKNDDIPSATAALRNAPRSHPLTEHSNDGQENTEVNCDDLNEQCEECLNLHHCMFVRFDNMETRCVQNTTNIAAVNNLIEGAKFEELLESNFEDQCSKSDIKPTQIPPKFSTDFVNDTTTSTTSSTSTSTTTKSTSSSTTTSTTTKTTTSTTTVTSTTTTTKASTSATSPKTPVNPDDRSGSRFDGWSFFGGILLTV